MSTILPGQKSYPNQSIVTIHKPQYKENFLQVAIDEWEEAFKTMPRISFALYLYLCGNQNGFPLALSPADFMKKMNVSKSSYDRAVDDLLAAGYLMMRNDKKNTMDFYTSPQPTDYVKKDYNKKKPTTGGGTASAEPVSMDDAPCELSADEDAEYREYLASYSSSPYRWEEN